MTARHRAPETDRHRFDERVAAQEPRLLSLLNRLYADDPRLAAVIECLRADIHASWESRPADLRMLDTRRDRDPDWFQSNRMLAGVCYVERYAGTFAGLAERIPYFQELGLTVLHLMPVYEAPEPNSDGGYAVSSYRRTRPDLGTIDDLQHLAAKLRAAGISLALDFVFNHTSNEHEWARRAREGDPVFVDYYRIYDDRELPDAFERTTREIFPDDHPGSFTQLDDGRWVWTTFHSFQWDLDYSNPEVFRAMAGEMLFLANRGVEILRMDAVAFIWKQLDTPSENLPQAHLLLQAFNAVLRMTAPAVLFLSEAIVHPDDVVAYIDPDECELSYNPLQMALVWSTLATRDVTLLERALETRHTLPDGTAWVDYIRSHDDIGWTFDDEDARDLGVDPDAHRRFLNRFYAGDFPGSFARGIPFQTNPATGDSRVAGATASLAGLEAGDPLAVRRILLAQSITLSTGGIPLLYLGDEVGQQNDLSYLQDPGKRDDSRWAGRPMFPAHLHRRRNDPSTPAGELYTTLRDLLRVRASLPAFTGGRLIPFHTHDRHVLGYQRPAGRGATVLVLANVGDDPAVIDAVTLSGLPPIAVDAVTERFVDLREPLTLGPLEFVWLLV